MVRAHSGPPIKIRFEYSKEFEYSNLILKEIRNCTLKTEQDEINEDCIRASNREVKHFNCGTSNSRRVMINYSLYREGSLHNSKNFYFENQSR